MYKSLTDGNTSLVAKGKARRSSIVLKEASAAYMKKEKKKINKIF
jgi:hypothetical protein